MYHESEKLKSDRRLAIVGLCCIVAFICWHAYLIWWV